MPRTPTQSPPRTTQRIPHNPFNGSPEHGLYVEALRTLATVPRVQVTRHLAEQTVERLAPSFAYHGRRTCYRSRRLRVIARKVYRLIHSDAWQDAEQPVASAAYRERCRQRGIISGWSRRVLSDERDLRIVNLLEAGYTPDEAARLVGCSVRTVYRARNRVRLGCDTNTTSSRSDSPERSTEEICEEIQTTQRPRVVADRMREPQCGLRIMGIKRAAHIAKGRGGTRCSSCLPQAARCTTWTRRRAGARVRLQRSNQGGIASTSRRCQRTTSNRPNAGVTGQRQTR